jgi:two-component system, OmpR family, sensor histidine kinase VanS
MKLSIRQKLFAVISGLIVMYMLMSALLNTKYLPKYYLYTKKNVLVESYNSIKYKYIEGPEEIEYELEIMERTKGFHIIIQSSDFVTKYDSLPKKYNQNQKPSKQPSTQILSRNYAEAYIKSKAKEVLSGKTIIERATNHKLNSDFINMVSLLSNGDIIFITTPVAAIEESVQISNKFFFITGLITVVIGIISIFIITGRFTRPILEMNTVAQRMALLDFDKKYSITTEDELGELGKSINSLSDQLKDSILELRSANEILKRDIEKERKVDEMRKEFIHNVSHELKTPIALIQGYSEGLKLNVNDDEENKNFYCEVISDEARKMNSLVKQLLDIAQIEAGETEIDKAPFEILPLINQVIKKNAILFQERNINILISGAEECRVIADYSRVEQILMNYITNALNHIDEKGILKIKAAESGSKVRVSVFNSGKQIPEDKIEKIWQSFYKVDKARTRNYGGTGLGLSIVRAIQEAHNNRYGVDNVEDGVEFWFELDIVNKVIS